MPLIPNKAREVKTSIPATAAVERIRVSRAKPLHRVRRSAWQTGSQWRPSRRCGCAKFPEHENAPAIPSVRAPAHFHRGGFWKISEYGCERGRKVVAKCRRDRARSAMLPLFGGTTCQRANSARLQKWLGLNQVAQS